LNDRQRAVLEWIAAGSQAGEEPVPTYKQSATALASRGLIDLNNRHGMPWRATLTALGRYWLDHHAYPPVGMVLEPLIEHEETPSTPAEALSDAELVNRRRVLRSDWNAGGEPFTHLDLAEQWALHAAYQPTKDVSEQQALADFREMQRLRPEQADEAEAACERYGRARQPVQRDAARAQEAKESGVAPRKRRGKERNLTVRTLARPEPDVQALARLLVQLAIDSAKADERSDAPNQSPPPNDTEPPASKASEVLAKLPLMRGEPMRPPARRGKKSRPTTPPTARPVPPHVQAKLDEARSCQRAGTYLAAVLVARAALTDALDNFGAPQEDDLTRRLDRLAQDEQLDRTLAARAAASRPMSIVPSHPEVTAAESENLIDIAAGVITELYPRPTTT
jgi:hypothetical protein